MSKTAPAADRVQTGVRLEKRVVKVLKALAALQDLPLGDLLENLVHRAFAGKLALEPPVLAQVVGLAVQVRRPDPNAADKGSVRLIRSWVVGAISPPERLLHGTGHGIRGMWTNYIDLIHVRKQNKELKAELDRLRLEQDSLAEEQLLALKALFNKRLYIELSRHGMAEEQAIEARMIALAYKHSLPLVATNDAYFLKEDMFEAHDACL